ncbi:MAG: hypothetical protein GX139_05575 [Armatimonadetes bacterium]|jgi:hypothetical protein|nr:hypothetical protein [Armatimonadota bacterium]
MNSVIRLVFVVSVFATLMSATCVHALPPGFAQDFTYKQTDGAVDILKGSTVVARYVYKDTSRPYIYPLLSPAGLAVTRDFPMKTVEGDQTDHPHQKSMWTAFGDVNGIDFWAESDKCGKIVQKSIDFDPISVGQYWSIHTSNDWLLPDGSKLMQDVRKIAFQSCDYGTLIVTRLVLNASECNIKFGDSKEGFFGIRVAPSMTVTKGKGHILNSEGDKDNDAWGKRAKWVDYTGEVNGKKVGITMFDSPYNYGYPTYWHARDYGLVAANPFGGKEFSGDAKNDSSMTIEYTNSIRFVYVTLIHDGEIDAKTLDELAEQVVGSPKEKPAESKDKPQENSEDNSPEKK